MGGSTNRAITAGPRTTAANRLNRAGLNFGFRGAPATADINAILRGDSVRTIRARARRAGLI